MPSRGVFESVLAKRPRLTRLLLALALLHPCLALADEAWVEPMRKVHGRFQGTRGTFAHFGDSITVSRAFWSPLAHNPKGMDAATAQALSRVKGYQLDDCWSKWKGGEFGNEGGMTIRWAHENVERWLKKLNPETVLIMFGTNDLGQLEEKEYAEKTRAVVTRCLDHGSVVILSTLPPRSGMIDKSRRFAEAVRGIGRELNVPVVDYFEEVLKRRPNDWDGSLAKFKDSPGDEYQVPTLISRDGVHPSNPRDFQAYNDEGLSKNGYLLRSYLVLRAYAEVIDKVLADPTERLVELKKGDRILFFGDSLTALAGREEPKKHVTKGYVRIVREAIKERHKEKDVEVDWVATGGHTVPDLLKRVEKDVIAKKPTIVVIQIGCNDARRIPQERFRAGLIELIDKLEAAKIQVVQCSLTSVGEKHDGTNPDDPKLEAFAETARAIAQEKKVPLIDLRKAFVAYWKKHNPDNKYSGFLTYDGNHFNDAGHKFVAEQMLGKFK
jgi:lysophospholipase L1-like esterase